MSLIFCVQGCAKAWSVHLVTWATTVCLGDMTGQGAYSRSWWLGWLSAPELSFLALIQVVGDGIRGISVHAWLLGSRELAWWVGVHVLGLLSLGPILWGRVHGEEGASSVGCSVIEASLSSLCSSFQAPRSYTVTGFSILKQLPSWGVPWYSCGPEYLLPHTELSYF